MTTWNTSSSSKALEGVHGVHMVPHAPFQVHELSQHGDCHHSTCEEGSGSMESNQRLLMR